MATERIDLSPPAIEIFSKINTKLIEIMSTINDIGAGNNKRYMTPHEIENQYGLKKSLQAKLRMDKENGPPYVRPSGSRVVLYNRKDFENWLEEWRTI